MGTDRCPPGLDGGGLDVIVLAGGRGQRMGGAEKGLLEVGGRRLLDRAVDAGQTSGVGPVSVAVSPHAPRTARYAASRGYPTVETPGDGYVEDVQRLLERRYPFLSVAVDLPFVEGRHLADLERAYRGRSLTGVLPLNRVPAEIPCGDRDLLPGGLLPVGLNVVDRTVEEERFPFRDPLLAYNVNTPQDLRLARREAARVVAGRPRETTR